MILSETDLQLDMLYMGPGKSCRTVLRCDKLGFSETIDPSDEPASKQRLLAHLEQCVYDRFRTGDFAFEPTRQSTAKHLHGLSDAAILVYTYSEDRFIRSFVRFELVRRGIFEPDLYRLGLHGNSFVRNQAIKLLQTRSGQNAEDPPDIDTPESLA